jgi:valyl-tRNA synthetase
MNPGITEDNKITVALQRQADAETEFKKRSQQVRDLLIKDHVGKDAEYLAMTKNIAAMREKLHRLRLNIGRKNFSLKTKEKSISNLRKVLETLEQQEKGLNIQFQKMQEDCEKLKDRVAARIQAKVEKKLK